MWKLIGKLSPKIVVAVSGGADSMALLHFLIQNPKREVQVVLVDHNTDFHMVAEPFVSKFCREHNLCCWVSPPGPKLPNGVSPEEHWRNWRYNYLMTFSSVVTAHHLDDVCETWLWSAMHGTPKLIPYQRYNVTRPLLAVSKQEILDYCERHSVPYLEDPSNQDTRYTRNHIRHELMPKVLDIHPGFRTTMRNKVLTEYAEYMNLTIDELGSPYAG